MYYVLDSSLQNDNSQDVATQLNVITTNTEEIDPVDIGVIGTLAENLAEDASNPQVDIIIIDDSNLH